MPMECVYTRFRLYDFEKDPNFLRGVETLRIDEKNPEKMLKLKIFFYNKFVEPITFEGYQEWSSSFASPSKMPDKACVLEPDEKCCPSVIKSDEHMVEKGNVLEATSTCLLEGSTVPQATSPPLEPVAGSGSTAPLSFAEVFRLIQAGEEIPGLQKLEIQPCDQPPTASQMSRKPKPWEKEAASS